MNNVKTRYIHFIIMFILTIVICICPPFGQVTPMGMKVLGIFLGVLYGWIFIDLIWPSIFGFAALGIANIYTVNQALSLGIGNQQLLMMLVTIVFAGALEEAGFTDFVSTWLLKKAYGKNPWILITSILGVAYVLGVLGAGMAGIFLLWSIVVRISKICNMPSKSPLVSFMIAMIVIFSFNGQLVIPFHGSALVFNGFFIQATGIHIAYVPFIVYLLLITVLLCIVILLLARFGFKLDASQFVLPAEMYDEMRNKMTTKKQKISLAILIAFMVLLLMPELTPFLPGMDLISALGLVGIGIIFLLLMNFIVVDGEPMIDLGRTFQRHVQWPLVLLLAVTFPLADALKASESGIMSTLNTYILPLISDMNATTFMIIVMVVLGILTQFTHNVVLGAMFIPFLCPLCVQLGGNQIVLWFLLYVILQAAFATPAASMQAAMIHGHSEVSSKWAYLWGTINLVINIVVLAVIGIPLGNMIFG